MPEAETIRIHGLRSEDLVDAPPLSEVLDELLARAHRAGRSSPTSRRVEERFLRRALLRRRRPSLRNPVIDTARARRRALLAPRARRRERSRLTPLARELGLPVHRPHDADGDALTTAQVFLALATQLDAIEPQTIGSLRRAAPPLAGPGRRCAGRCGRLRRR